jgi:nicotinate-nucleotide adenylyltransferase
VDTLRLLHAQSPEAQFVLLIGLDAFREIGTWKEYRALFGLADVAVMSRPGERRASLRTLIPVAARKDFCYRESRTILLHDTGKKIIALDVTALNVSATDIRLRVQRGQSIRYLVPTAVEDYLRRRRIYGGRCATL